MGFWSWLKGGLAAGEKPNANPPSVPDSVGPGYHPGDPHGATDENFMFPTYSRSLPIIQPSPWSGYPAEWGMPDWRTGIDKLVDTAWDCIDLNSSILSSMPVYRLAAGIVLPGPSWMTNPHPDLYASWAEFAKALFWDYQTGEAFVLATDWYATDKPAEFFVLPKDLVKIKMEGLRRRYFIGQVELNTDPDRQELLHIRYKSYVGMEHGVGPLDAAGARLTTAGVLQRQVDEVARTGGVPPYILEVQRRLRLGEANEVLDQWADARASAGGAGPGLVSGGTKATPMPVPSAKEMALLELSMFTEARICIKLGVPPFLMGLPHGGDSMTYSNVSQLFDYHDRASLKTKATHVMQALSGWALPRRQSAELNRDEYSRPALPERAKAYVDLHSIPDVLSADEIRSMERFHGEVAASRLTGGNEDE
jgi:Phage portal protein